jgi:glycosyltransferase involved in cell wall biosynthesis
VSQAITHVKPSVLDPHLLSRLQCPASKASLRESNDQLYLESETGGHRYPVTSGFPVFYHPESVLRPELSTEVEVSVLIMALDEAGNIEPVVTDVGKELLSLGVTYEIVVVDGGSSDDTVQLATNAGARVVPQTSKGYAAGLIQGLQSLRGRYVITLDGDCSHDPTLIKELLRATTSGCIVIGSRWMSGGSFKGPLHRQILSRLLNRVFTAVLHIPATDISSGYRLYARETLYPNEYQSRDFSILEEILVRARMEGFNLREIPLHYKQRKDGASHARLAAFALSYLTTLRRMWMLRHDAGAADYDHRAYDSLNLVQRWWQRSRFKNIRAMMQGYWFRGDVLDVGCGSSRIIQNLKHAVALDTSVKKLRFLGDTNARRVCGSALALPFKDGSFDCLIHSQLIEHLPKDDAIFTEIHRVLRPGGCLIIGTVDFGTWIWPTIERLYGLLLPHAYAQEHISPYTLDSLKETLVRFGFRVEEVKSILKGEITIRAIRL